MEEIPLPYQPDAFCLRLPLELKNDVELAGLAEALSTQKALEALNYEHRGIIKSIFRNLIERTYKGLQDPMTIDRSELFRIIDKRIAVFSSAVKQMLNQEPRDQGWAYSLTLSRAWTVLDSILQAHKGIEYRGKKEVRFMIPNYYPSVLEVFEESGLPLSDFEAEVVSDLCIGASARDGKKAIDAARQMTSSFRESPLAKRSGSKTERLGDDFLEVLLSIKYTKPAENKT